MWIKAWNEGNGGLSYAEKIIELPDNYTKEHIEEYVKGTMQSYEDGCRGSKYKVIQSDEVPPSYFSAEIVRRDKELARAWELLKEVPHLQKLKEASLNRIEAEKKLSIGEVLTRKWDYSSEKTDFFRKFFDGYITIYLKDEKVNVRLLSSNSAKTATFEPTDLVSDLVDWANA